jgi:hypothetical protein
MKMCKEYVMSEQNGMSVSWSEEGTVQSEGNLQHSDTKEPTN